jgi:hypothetical protein
MACPNFRNGPKSSLGPLGVKNKHPLPKVDDLFDHLHRSKLFPKLNLKNGYDHIEILKM